jgi:hypothetical protein
MIAIQGCFVERKASKSNQMDAALARIVTHSKLSRFVSNCIGGHIHTSSGKRVYMHDGTSYS